MGVKCVGGCVGMFSAAVAIDVVGLALLLVGVFANLRLDGRFYGDFLIYSGSLVVFASSACWLMWYVGNIRVPEGDPDRALEKSSSFARLVRKLSARLNPSVKGGPDPRGKYVEDGDGWRKKADDEDDEEGGGGGVAAHKASRVTWGRSAAYPNDGFEGSLDPVPRAQGKGRPGVPRSDGAGTGTGTGTTADFSEARDVQAQDAQDDGRDHAPNAADPAVPPKTLEY